jgi:hypothetical protein
MRKKLPVGIEAFDEFFREDFYYIDKTGFISDFLHSWSKVNLFTRPRRFGKSLNMSMLKSFFEIGGDMSAFDGLKIMQEKELCDQFMGKFPVIFLTLKGVEGCSFEAAKESLRFAIGMEAERFAFLADSDRLSDRQRAAYRSLVSIHDNGSYTMSDAALAVSLKTLSLLLSKHYGTNTIILIDEYDVPLDKAYEAGYYEEMASLIRILLGNALKTNESLQFAVLTGCLRISKESIFTGLNNLRVNSITDAVYDEYFGFTDDEVKHLLDYYDLSGHYETVKKWYNGYRFGNTSIYCPWDVINYCYDACLGNASEPKNYWAKTSGNNMIRRFIDRADQQTRSEIEQLIAGGTVTKKIDETLTYSELDSNIDNLWSVLFATGYLTSTEKRNEGRYSLTIPNDEIKDLFSEKIKEWFSEKVKAEPSRLKMFCEAVISGDEKAVEEQLTKYLRQTIALRDEAVRKTKKENFYHGILLGLLGYPDTWRVRSNAEAGDGYSDICIMDDTTNTGVVIEVKYAEKGNFDSVCKDALEQIEDHHYDKILYEEGMDTIIRFGIAFYKKRCKVVRG